MFTSTVGAVLKDLFHSLALLSWTKLFLFDIFSSLLTYLSQHCISSLHSSRVCSHSLFLGVSQYCRIRMSFHSWPLISSRLILCKLRFLMKNCIYVDGVSIYYVYDFAFLEMVKVDSSDVALLSYLYCNDILYSTLTDIVKKITSAICRPAVILLLLSLCEMCPCVQCSSSEKTHVLY